MSFVETRINDGLIVYETVGGAEYSTEIAVTRSGFEARNINWAIARGRWQLGDRVLTKAELAGINRFFHAMRGRAYGFRFKDWSDYQAGTDGVLGTGFGSGLAAYQLGKKYAQGSQSVIRPIKKPVATGFAVQRNGSAVGGVTLNTVTGIVTVPPIATFNISAVTNANPGVVSAAGHTFSNGDQIVLATMGGMPTLTGLKVTIGGVGAGVFNIGMSTIGLGTYTSGGTASKYPQPADVLTWTGEFDVPVRFDTDAIRTTFKAMTQDQTEALHYLDSLEIVELRL